jgi:pimeloyl-ACP methyl ester carboxylesterase
MFRFLKNFINKLHPARSLYVAFDSGGKNKPTIVLLHGIAATSKTWDSLIKELDMDEYRVIALDLLGFGKSPKPVSCEYTVDDHVASVHKTLLKLKVRNKPYKIVGHSMGAIISARYCIRYPKEVKKLYLLSLPLYVKDSELHTNISRTRTDFYLNAYEFLSQNKGFTINNSQILRKLLRIDDGIEVTEENWNSFRLSLKNTIIKQDTYNDIRNTKVPIQIIYGALDEFLVQRIVDKLAKFDNVKITKLLAINHFVGSRFAKEVAKIIRSD